LAGGKGSFNFFQNKNSLPTAFVGRWQRILCQLPLLAGGKGFFANCLYWQVAKGALVISAQPNVGSSHEILAFV
jgi:hypothetical protein